MTQHSYVNEFLEAAKIVGVLDTWATSKSLYKLIENESAWKPDARNKYTSAFGLFQMIPSTWKSYLKEVPHGNEDPKWQAVGGFRYIRENYKTPKRAWEFWQATSLNPKDVSRTPQDLQIKAKEWIEKGITGY